MIEDYGFGHVRISGQDYDSDVIVHGDRITSWWRAKGHSVSQNDIRELVDENPAMIVIGTGAYGVMRVPPATKQFIKEQGIDLVVEKTKKAVETFNELREEGADAAIAMHLTC